MGKKNKNKKKKKKIKDPKKYPSNVEERAKEATKIEPPDVNEYKMDNEEHIDKWVRFRPKVKQKYKTLKEESRHKN